MGSFQPDSSHRARFAWGHWLVGIVLLSWSGPATAQAPPREPEPPTPSAGALPPAPRDAPAAPEPDAEPIDPELRAQYTALVTEAITEFDARRWAEARALFLRAHELRPSARTLRTLGMTSFELSDYPRAINELSQALSDPRRPLDEEQRSQVASLLERAKRFVGRYQVESVPSDALLWVDGVPYTRAAGEYLQLSVGSHQITARAPGYLELNRRIKVQGGEEQPLTLALNEQAPPAPPPVQPEAPLAQLAPGPTAPEDDVAQSPLAGRVWTWMAAGTGVAFGAASTVLWLSSDRKYERLKKRCAPHCTKEDEDPETNERDIEKLQTAHQITLGLAIAAGAGAVALFFVEGDDGEQEASVGFGPTSVEFTTHF